MSYSIGSQAAPAVSAQDKPSRSPASRFSPRALLPGALLTIAVSVVSILIAAGEERLFGHAIIEALVVAILVGIAARSVWEPPASTRPGVKFAAKEVLELAVLMLGASMDLPLLLRAGPSLALGIILIVIIGIATSFTLGRALGLPTKHAILVACGNSICGNSAIAAVAPVIGAEESQITSSIAFTAILGVIVVLGLPLLAHPLGLDHYQYGVLAGLTVYAVPQVLAAAFPVSVLSGQIGTLVKLVRVLMLGPVVLFFALLNRRSATGTGRVSLGRFVPWFIVGFLMLAALRSVGVLSAPVIDAAHTTSVWLTVAAMAALGLGVDLKQIRGVGAPVIATVTGSLIVLLALAVTLIKVLAIH